MQPQTAIPLDRLPPARYRADAPAQIFSPGALVTVNGHTGKVSGHKDGKAVVTFGTNKRREIDEAELTAFVPWYSERD